MAFSAGTFRAATGMAEGTLEEGAAKDLIDLRDRGGEMVSFVEIKTFLQKMFLEGKLAEMRSNAQWKSVR